MTRTHRTPARPSTAGVLLLAGALAAGGCSGPEPVRLKIGAPYDHPGLSLAVTGEHVGLDSAVGRYVARDLGAEGRDEVSFVNQPARSRFAAVAAGTVRLGLGSDPIPPRYAHDVVGVGPYLVSGLQVATRRGAPTDLRGKRVCATVGSRAEENLTALLPGAVAAPAKTISTCLTDVVEGRAAAALDDGLVLRGYAANPAFSSLTVQPRRLTTTEHLVLVPATDDDLCRRVTASLRTMVASGAWDRAVRGDLVTTGVLDAVPARPAVRGCG